MHAGSGRREGLQTVEEAFKESMHTLCMHITMVIWRDSRLVGDEAKILEVSGCSSKQQK
jgi:hypothetical protein